MFKLLLIFILSIIPIKSLADSTEGNNFVTDISVSWGLNARVSNKVECGRTIYYAFGPGSNHTATGSTDIFDVLCPNGADIIFISAVGSTGVDGTINAVYQVGLDGTDEGSEPMANSDVIEPLSVGAVSALGAASTGSSNPAYGLGVGKFWIDYTAGLSGVSLIRIRGR